MKNLEKLEKKVNQKNEVLATDTVDNVDHLKLSTSIDAIYRLVNNTTRRIERKLDYIEQKQDIIIKVIESSGVDLEELQKQEKIKQLEQKLKKLRGE